MGIRHWIAKLVVSFLGVLLVMSLLSCEPQDSGPKTWIDEPIDGASVPVGTPVKITSHAFARQGIKEVQLSIDGKPFKRSPADPPGSSFGKVSQDWLPDKVGVYVLQVSVSDTQGQASQPATVKVRVVDKLTLRVTPMSQGAETLPTTPAIFVAPTTPSFSVKPTATWTLLPPVTLVQPTATWTLPRPITPEQPTATWTLPSPITLDIPTATFTPTPTSRPTDTPWPPAQIDFRADQTSIEKGKCTTLRWDVEYATSVFLDGDGVAGHDSRQVCPNQTQAYTLRVEAPQGGGDRQVTIQVSVPRDTTPPPVPQPAVPANGLKLDFRSNQNLVWVPVNDPSGIEGYYVKLEVQVKKGEYQSVRGWGPVGGKQVEADVQCGAIYRWTVRAQDKAGNYSDWASWSMF